MKTSPKSFFLWTAMAALVATSGCVKKASEEETNTASTTAGPVEIIKLPAGYQLTISTVSEADARASFDELSDLPLFLTLELSGNGAIAGEEIVIAVGETEYTLALPTDIDFPETTSITIFDAQNRVLWPVPVDSTDVGLASMPLAGGRIARERVDVECRASGKCGGVVGGDRGDSSMCSEANKSTNAFRSVPECANACKCSNGYTGGGMILGNLLAAFSLTLELEHTLAAAACATEIAAVTTGVGLKALDGNVKGVQTGMKIVVGALTCLHKYAPEALDKAWKKLGVKGNLIILAGSIAADLTYCYAMHDICQTALDGEKPYAPDEVCDISNLALDAGLACTMPQGIQMSEDQIKMHCTWKTARFPATQRGVCALLCAQNTMSKPSYQDCVPCVEEVTQIGQRYCETPAIDPQ